MEYHLQQKETSLTKETIMRIVGKVTWNSKTSLAIVKDHLHEQNITYNGRKHHKSETSLTKVRIVRNIT
jgi:hypothetical protein